MTLTAADVAEIMRLVEQSGFDRADTGDRWHEDQSAARGVGECEGCAAGRRCPTPKPPWYPGPHPIPALQDLPSPLLGTFYRAPKPGAPPFVEIGAQVEADTIVAIIEVMKLMNTVRAGVRGTVAEILKADGALAEYGETLMRVRKSG